MALLASWRNSVRIPIRNLQNPEFREFKSRRAKEGPFRRRQKKPHDAIVLVFKAMALLAPNTLASKARSGVAEKRARPSLGALKKIGRKSTTVCSGFLGPGAALRAGLDLAVNIRDGSRVINA